MTTRRQFCTTALTAALATPLGTRAHTVAPDATWTFLADLPAPVQEIYPAAHAVDDTTFIVNAGGLAPGESGFGATDAVHVYDVAADAWRAGTPLPAARHHLGLASADGALFALSGFAFAGGGGWQMRTEAWRIDDPRAGAWQPVAPLPAPQSEAVYLVHDGRIHVIGGRTPAGRANSQWQDQTDTGRHVVYDPDADAWTARAPLPMARNSAAGAVHDGRLFVVAGRTVAGGNNAFCDVYDPVEDRWEHLPALPVATQRGAPNGRGGLAAAIAGGYLYAFGGEWFDGDGGVYRDVVALDLAELRWHEAGRMPRPRHGLGAVAIDGSIYLIGGATQRGGNGTCGWLDRFTPA